MKRWLVVLLAVCAISSCLVFSVSAAEPETAIDIDRERYPYWIKVSANINGYVFSQYPGELVDGYIIATKPQYIAIATIVDGIWVVEEQYYSQADLGSLTIPYSYVLDGNCFTGFPFDVDVSKYPYWINVNDLAYIFSPSPFIIIDDVCYVKGAQTVFFCVLSENGWETEIRPIVDYDNACSPLYAVVDSNCIVGFPSYSEVSYPEFPSYNRSDYPYYFLSQDSSGTYGFVVCSQPFYKSQYANAYCVNANAQGLIYYYGSNGWTISGEINTGTDGMCLPFDGKTILTSNHLDGFIPEDVGLIESVAKLFRSALTWVGTVASTMASNPILLCFLVLPIAFIGVGLFRRIKD